MNLGDADSGLPAEAPHTQLPAGPLLRLFIQRTLGRDEQDKTAGAHIVQRRREKVIMNEKVPTLETRVERLVIAKGDAANGHVETAVGQDGLLEGLAPNIGVRIEQFGRSGGDRVNLDPGDSRTRLQVVGHEADEVPQAHRRFEHPTLGKPESAWR